MWRATTSTKVLNNALCFSIRHSQKSTNLYNPSIQLLSTPSPCMNHCYRQYARRVTEQPAPPNASAANHSAALNQPITSKNDLQLEEIQQSLRNSAAAAATQGPSGVTPPRWRPDSPSLKNVKNFATAQERGKHVSITGRIYSTNEFTEGLIEILERIPQLNSCFTDPNTLITTRATSKKDNKQQKTDNSAEEQERERQNIINKLFVQAITHKSFGTGKVEYNERMAFMGRHILSLYVSELCSSKYGSDNSLNMNSIKLTEAIYTNPCTLAYIVALKYWQINPLNTLRCYGWSEMTSSTQKDILADVVYSMITVVFEVKGPRAADQFIEQVLIQENPSEIFKQLLHAKNNETILMDVMQAYTGNPLRVVDEKMGHNNHKCSYFDGIQLVGYATADMKGKARNLAAMNGLVAIGTKLPQY